MAFPDRSCLIEITNEALEPETENLPEFLCRALENSPDESWSVEHPAYCVI